MTSRRQFLGILGGLAATVLAAPILRLKPAPSVYNSHHDLDHLVTAEFVANDQTDVWLVLPDGSEYLAYVLPSGEGRRKVQFSVAQIFGGFLPPVYSLAVRPSVPALVKCRPMNYEVSEDEHTIRMVLGTEEIL